MDHTPEEYGEYWGGAIRIAAGVLLVFYSYQFFSQFTDLLHDNPLGWLFIWGVFGVVVVVGCFAVSIGLAKVIRAAVHGAG